MTRIPWYYIWSQKYEIFHTILQDITSKIYPNLRQEFAIRPIFIEQQILNSKLSQNKEIHPFTGCSVKIDALINCIETNMNEYFIFSDIDIIITKSTIKDLLIPYLTTDMVFMKEDLKSSEANIGFCLIKASSKTLKFWKQVKIQVEKEKAHDQEIVNKLLLETDCSTALFSENEIISQKTCSNNRDFRIVQILSTGHKLHIAEKIEALSIFIKLDPYKYLLNIV